MTITFNVLGFNQEKLIKLMNEKNININGNDLIVLRNIIDMMERMQTKKFDGEIYSWIKYSLLVENLPIVSNKEDTFKKIVTKLIKCDLLKRKVIKYVGHGTYTYFKTTKTLEDLLYVEDRKNTIESPKLTIESPKLKEDKDIKTYSKKVINSESYKKDIHRTDKFNYNKFNNFENRNYDYDKLELMLLGWDTSLTLNDCIHQ